MFKKLVKHGNSRALILEKPLLELMGIEEDGYIKVSVLDTNRLVIQSMTSEMNQAEKSQLTFYKKMSESLAQTNGRSFEEYQASPEFQSDYTAFSPLFMELWKKYDVRDSLLALEKNTDYLKELEDLMNRLDPIKQQDQYMEQLLAIRHKYAPELKQYDDEMQKIARSIKS